MTKELWLLFPNARLAHRILINIYLSTFQIMATNCLTDQISTIKKTRLLQFEIVKNDQNSSEVPLPT